MLELDGVTVRYGAILGAENVSLTAESGVVALLGANGAGKTSTLKAISGLVRPAGGRIQYQGVDITGLAPHAIVARGICHVPEGREIFAGLSVLDNLRLGGYRRRDRKGIAEDLDRFYDYFPVLRQRHRQDAATLSGGEQQMLVLARALMGRPSLLLLDEPSLGLAPMVVQQVFDILAQICADLSLQTLIVEQDVQVALSLAASGYVMAAGHVVASGTSAELLADATLRDSYLGRAPESTP